MSLCLPFQKFFKILFIYFFAVLGIEPRALCMQGKNGITESHPRSYAFVRSTENEHSHTASPTSGRWLAQASPVCPACLGSVRLISVLSLSPLSSCHFLQ